MNTKPALYIYALLALAQSWGVIWYSLDGQWLWAVINAIGATAWGYNGQRTWAALNQWTAGRKQ